MSETNIHKNEQTEEKLLTPGENIKRARKEKNLTQVEFAKIIGVSVSTLSKYENNRTSPKFEIANKILECLGKTTKEIWYLEEPCDIADTGSKDVYTQVLSHMRDLQKKYNAIINN